jgi:predicted nucleic acid-binding Zn ribbon protein
MNRRGLRPVARVVDQLLRGLGIATDVARIDATRAWPAVAAATLGSGADLTKALRVDGTTLVVAVPTSAWASEIRLRETQLLEGLAKASPRSGITALRAVPSASSGGRGTSGP